jgi:hypothetical protein
MGEDKKSNKKKERTVPKAPVQMVVSREYVGTQTLAEAFVPVIYEDIKKNLNNSGTFDSGGLTA